MIHRGKVPKRREPIMESSTIINITVVLMYALGGYFAGRFISSALGIGLPPYVFGLALGFWKWTNLNNGGGFI